MHKIPEVTLVFWVIKILATTLGETGGDLLSMTLNLGYAVSTGLFFVFFALALGAQVAAKTYHRFLYWAVILATTTLGTTVSDFLDRSAGLGYVRGALLLAAALGAVMGAWRLSTGSVAIANIRTRPAEVFYWVTILASNTLGTALGDFLADSSGLGYRGGALLIGVVLAVIAIAYWRTRISRTLLFWLAFVLTRPLGATVGDLLTKSHSKGGFDLGTIPSSLVLVAALTLLIGLSSRRSEASALKSGATP